MQSPHYTDKVRSEITYPFLNFNGFTIEVWEWISNFIPYFIGCVFAYPYWDFILIPVNKRGPITGPQSGLCWLYLPANIGPVLAYIDHCP